jgi:hypothetical protein
LGGGPPRFPRPSTWTAVLRSSPADRQLSPTGLSPPPAGRSRPLRLAAGFVQLRGGSPGPPGLASNPHAATAGALARHGFGLLPVRSPLLREYSLFLGVLRCFSSPGALPIPMRSALGDRVPPAGLPHSGTLGSQPASGSPRHYAAWPRPSSARHAKASTLRSCSRPFRLLHEGADPSSRNRCRRLTSPTLSHYLKLPSLVHVPPACAGR